MLMKKEILDIRYENYKLRDELSGLKDKYTDEAKKNNDLHD